MIKNKWLLIPKPTPNAALKLICFPYAGGNTSTFSPWLSELPNNIELILIQLPGRGSRLFEDIYYDMGSLIKKLLEFFPTLIDKPYILFGHSLGSRVAFELATKLKEMGKPLPEHFVASGSRAPHFAINEKQIHNLPDKEFISELRQMGGTPDEILDNEELIELLLPALKADFTIAEKYFYLGNEVLDCPISVLGGKNDIEVTVASLNGWSDLFLKPAEVHMIAGGHFFIDTNRDAVLLKLNEIICSYLR